MLTNRRREIEGIIRAAESLNSQEDRDFAVITEILKVSQASGTSLGEAQAKALALAETYNKIYKDIENTRVTAKTIQTQYESDPEAAATKENVTGLLKSLKAQTQGLEDILTTTQRYIGERLRRLSNTTSN